MKPPAGLADNAGMLITFKNRGPDFLPRWKAVFRAVWNRLLKSCTNQLVHPFIGKRAVVA